MSTSPRACVEIEEVTKRFGPVTAVDRAALAIGDGEFFALLGPSGCGKTTLLRMIAGFEEPCAGTIRIAGQDMGRIPAHRRPVHMVFQHYALFPHLTVAENVAFGLRYKGLARREEGARVTAALARVRLGELARRRPDQLSGGQRQRVALARALVLEPRVLLLDEPLAALDPSLRREVQRELKGLQRELGITFVFVTHDRQEALAMSDRIAVMNHGQVAQVGTPAEVFEQPQTGFVARFLGATNIFAAEVRQVKNGSLVLGLANGAELTVPSGGQVRLCREPVRFVVRPEKLALSASPARAEASLPVVVEDRVYHGTSTEWIVRDRQGERFTALSQNVGHAGEAPAFSPGSAAFLSWDPRHSVVLREE